MMWVRRTAAAASPRLWQQPKQSLLLCRGLATRLSTKEDLPPAEVLEQHFPTVPPKEPFVSKDPAAYVRGPVTSAHMIDTEARQVSTLDSAALSPTGSVLHGRYGDLGTAASAIPLEFLALLRPAAEAAAALRVISATEKTKKGTLLLYGASLANGLAAAQMASAAGHAVVGVVSAEHAGDKDMVELVKGLVEEPGTAVPESYALCKKKFADLVQGISTGDEGIPAANPNDFLAEFKQNLVDYTEAYPNTRPAAVDASVTDFDYMEKDREEWDANMEAYLSQFPPGAPPLDTAKFDALFSPQQYQLFKHKFWQQTTAAITGDASADATFSPPHLVQAQIEAPEDVTNINNSSPYAFSALSQVYPTETEAVPGGPIVGAIVAVTPTLQTAAEKIAKAGKNSSKRAMGEALQFLTHREKATFGAACSVVACATQAGAPVVVMGGTLPGGLKTVQETADDVQTALQAMDVDENGQTALNFFVELYRSNDFPFYADYAVFQATQVLPPARQVIVTK